MSDTEPKQEIETEEVEQVTVETTEVVITGGRVRRTIQKFGFTEKEEEEEEEFKPPVGAGIKLSEMEVVAERISNMGKKDAETIKSLYSIMYGRRFQQKNIRTIKEHILDFSGVPDADEKVRLQLAGKMGRWMRNYVQDIMDVLGVDRSKKSFDEEGKPFDKEALINRLVEWLCNPQESAGAKKKSATPVSKKKSPSAKTAKKAAKTTVTGTKRKSAATAKKAPAKKAKTAATKEEEDATESEVDGQEDEEEKDDDSDFDEDEPKKAKKTTKRAPKKAAARRGKKTAAASDDDGDEDMDKDVADVTEEPKESNLGEDVQAKVKDIIAKGDAEQLTVKKIVRQLSEDMGQDFSSKKAAIKDFVTNLQM